MKKTILTLVTLSILAIISIGCNVTNKLGFLQNIDKDSAPASSIVMNEGDATKLSDKVPIHLYFGEKNGSKLRMEVRYVPISEVRKSVNNLASLIVKELIKGPDSNGNLCRTIPTNTVLRSTVAITSGTATVDLSGNIITDHTGGKDAEQLTIYSIVNSLTELKEIQKVTFLIDGKQRKEFKGNFKFDTAFSRSPSIINKQEAYDDILE